MNMEQFNIKITRPCTDVPGRFIVETSFGRRLSMHRLCAILKQVEGAKCSESLRGAKFEFKDNTLIVYENGRVDMRKVISADRAHETMLEVFTMLAGAFELE